MTVIAFESKLPQSHGSWQTCELKRLTGGFAPAVASGDAGGWETAATEIGHPQFYLLGPPPAEECILSISRLGRLYLLEDGTGRVLSEQVILDRLVADALVFLKEKRTRLVARVMLLCCALRHAFEEKVEPILAEGEELLTRVAPQLIALA